METGQRSTEPAQVKKPNRIEAFIERADSILPANDAYELDMWRTALAEGRRKHEFESQDVLHPMTEKTEYSA